MEQELSPFVQTDFSDLSKWEMLVQEVAIKNEMGFKAYVKPVSERHFAGAQPTELVAAFPDASVVFIIDERALMTKEVLCVDGEDGLLIAE